jgi:hypothetical protein
MLHEQKRGAVTITGRSTINTEAGKLVIEPGVGRVVINGASMLPHEAMLVASELERAARAAQRNADQLAAERRQAA